MHFFLLYIANRLTAICLLLILGGAIYLAISKIEFLDREILVN